MEQRPLLSCSLRKEKRKKRKKKRKKGKREHGTRTKVESELSIQTSGQTNANPSEQSEFIIFFFESGSF
jgi:hypothetical protein